MRRAPLEYSDADLAEIVKAAGGLPLGSSAEKLANDLIGALVEFSLRQTSDLMDQRDRRREQIIRKLALLERAAQQLLVLLSKDRGHDARTRPTHEEAEAHGVRWALVEQGANDLIQKDLDMRRRRRPDEDPALLNFGVAASRADACIDRLIRDATTVTSWATVITRPLDQAQDAAVVEDEQKVDPPSDPVALDWLIAEELPRLYEAHFSSQSMKGRSKLRFIQACLGRIGLGGEPNAVKQRRARAGRRSREG